MTTRAAAEALGKAPHGFETTLSTARKQFLALWHEGEQPSTLWGRDRRSAKSRRVRDHYKKITVITIRARARKRRRRELAHTDTDSTSRQTH
jgi:hypothetical protein